jgi:uncharacterized paraquat-inducible protein A
LVSVRFILKYSIGILKFYNVKGKNMNSGVIFGGAMLMLGSILFTIFTLGFGIICTGPLFLIGFVIFVLGFIIPGETKKDFYHYNRTQPTPMNSKRYCPKCGRIIPFDASICPYCGLKLPDNISTAEKSIFCTKCGFENKTDHIFCTKCGNKLKF